jgi:hypothetical protein
MEAHAVSRPAGTSSKSIGIVRSRTVGLNVVHRPRFDDTVVNLFEDGMARDSHRLPGRVSLAEALIWYGTTLKLQGE